MPKVAPDAMIDSALDYVAGATVLHVCSTLDSTPTLAEVAAASLADIAIDSGDFTKANGDTSGRKITIGAQSGVTVDNSGTAVDIALVDGSVVRYTTTCTSQVLTAGNTVNVPAWKIEIADPT